MRTTTGTTCLPGLSLIPAPTVSCGHAGQPFSRLRAAWEILQILKRSQHPTSWSSARLNTNADCTGLLIGQNCTLTEEINGIGIG